MGYLRLIEFTVHAAREVTEAVDRLTAQGATGWILDLRGNPGGRVDQAAEVAQLFVGSGRVALIATRTGTEVLETVGQPRTALPLVVLVNGDTASAAELLAGALKAHSRALLVGTATYGKAAIQQYYTLVDCSALCLTVGHYRTPDGTEIQGRGISPDVSVPTQGKGTTLGWDAQCQVGAHWLARLEA